MIKKLVLLGILVGNLHGQPLPSSFSLHSSPIIGPTLYLKSNALVIVGERLHINKVKETRLHMLANEVRVYICQHALIFHEW